MIIKICGSILVLKLKDKFCPIVISCIFLLFLQTNSVASYENNFNTSFKYIYQSGNMLGQKHHSRINEGHVLGLGIKYKNKNLSSKIELTKQQNFKMIFDGSYIDYSSGISTFGIGSINRNWSFSPNTSLILSSNARPIPSAYFKLKTYNKPSISALSWLGPWSIEAFNGILDVDRGPHEALLLGTRATINPLEGLDIEFIQTSQWGGDGYRNDYKALESAFIGNTNEDSSDYINKMAGIGLSYQFPVTLIPIRLYGQAIGEDEAGNLPSCFMHMYGVDWLGNIAQKPLNINLEVVDTRIDDTSHGNCGANTAYNNSTYSYTNKNITLGDELDTEGNSLAIHTSIDLSSSFTFKYSIKEYTINDSYYDQHRLSTSRQNGFLNSATLGWRYNNSNINLNLSHKNFKLDKKNIKNGINLALSADMKF